MANKTVPTDQNVAEFLANVQPERRRADAVILLELMKHITGHEPKMWGPSIIGFDQYHYKYESGREGDNLVIGFSPRKANMVLYIMPGFEGSQEIMARLGKHKTGRSCLYINKLADVDMDVLEELATKTYEHMKAKYA